MRISRLDAFVLIISLIFAIFVVNKYWLDVKDKAYPDRGDWDFYIKCCNHMPPQEYPLIPTMLHLINMVVVNPIISVLALTLLAYSFIFFFMYKLTFTLTNNKWFGLLGFTLIILSTRLLPVATALKNLFGIGFLLYTLTILTYYQKRRSKPLLFALAIGFTLTLLSHSLPIFALMVISALYLIHFNHDDFKAVFFPVGLYTLMGLLMFVTLSFTNRLYKFNYLFSSFTPSTIIYNWNRLSYAFGLWPYLQLFIISFAQVVIYQFLTKKFKPMLTGMLLSLVVLFFCGPYQYASRFHANAIPLLIVTFIWSTYLVLWRS